MVLIHNMDSDEEQLQIVSYEEPEAYAATSHSDNRMGIKMTPKVPPQFDGQSSWFEYEDLIDDWLGITTLDADKHGPSLKNALIGSASFYKSMLDNALLRDPDRGLTHFKDTLRPYFVKGVNHVFLWRFLQMFRTYRGLWDFHQSLLVWALIQIPYLHLFLSSCTMFVYFSHFHQHRLVLHSRISPMVV